MATLADRGVLTRAVRGIVRGMTVIGGHSMPERAPCCREAGRDQFCQVETREGDTHELAMTGETVSVVAATLTVGGCYVEEITIVT